MKTEEVYRKLALHLNKMGMGHPVREDLIEILAANLSTLEAGLLLRMPIDLPPNSVTSIDDLRAGVDLSEERLMETLNDLAERGMLFKGTTRTGATGYSLLQVGFGFPQTFFWNGQDTPHSRKMASAVAKYFNRTVTVEVYGGETKAYRYIPIGKSLNPELQAVFTTNMMDRVIENAKRIAVCHCPCRISYHLAGRGCGHPTEVCLKFDEMAEFVVSSGLGREIDQQEAMEIINLTEKAGLVHFVDNTQSGIKHNCNCCGCACWNVGNIRRRKIPRDAIMATYFIREVDTENCSGCGACIDICPVLAVKMEDDILIIEEEWCIGCGVCATACPNGCVSMKLRDDLNGRVPAQNFLDLHQQIISEKKGKRET